MKKGFTLVELLVTVFILSLLLGSIYHTFATGIFAWERGEESMNIYQEARQALAILTKDLRCSFISANKGLIFTGDKEQLSFFTLSNPISSSSQRQIGISKVSYSLGKDPALSGNCLMRKEVQAIGSLTLDEELSQAIAGNIHSLKLQYFYEDQWRDKWYSSQALPKMVKVTLRVLKGDKDIILSTETALPASLGTKLEEESE